MPSSYWDEALAAKYRAFQYHFPERPLEGRVFILARGAGGLGATTTTLLVHEGAFEYRMAMFPTAREINR